LALEGARNSVAEWIGNLLQIAGLGALAAFGIVLVLAMIGSVVQMVVHLIRR